MPNILRKFCCCCCGGNDSESDSSLAEEDNVHQHDAPNETSQTRSQAPTESRTSNNASTRRSSGSATTNVERNTILSRIAHPRQHHQHRHHQQQQQHGASNSHNYGSLSRFFPVMSPRQHHFIPARFPRKMIDELVLETLDVVRSLVDSEEEPPLSMMKLHVIAELETGLLDLVSSLIEVIPMENPMGPITISLLLGDCPLPSKETIEQMTNSLKENLHQSKEPSHHRNIAIILGCLAEKLAGPRSTDLFTPDIMEYLIANLESENHPAVILFSIVALEKFAQTSENKLTIQSRLHELLNSHPLVALEKFMDYEGCLMRQVGFCAQWSLDNIFCIETRPYSYQQECLEDINVMLNAHDVSEYLKISPDGLQARCDAASFESVRCTFEVTQGVWYYEAQVLTGGIMQIGWATKGSKFLNYDGFGIGDDEYSVAFDGCRQLFWYNARSLPVAVDRWKPGDYVGFLLDFEQQEIIFYLNGFAMPPMREVFKKSGKEQGTGFFAAASFMSFQQCVFNFGAQDFRYPPMDRKFESFNKFGNLTNEEKVILPRHIKLELLKRCTVQDNACNVCFDQEANCVIQPCGHQGFCSSCAEQCSTCPMCRGKISRVERVVGANELRDHPQSQT